jgi:hypothetical protein
MSFEITSYLPACGRFSRLGHSNTFVEFLQPTLAVQDALTRHFIKARHRRVSEHIFPDLFGGIQMGLFPVHPALLAGWLATQR